MGERVRECRMQKGNDKTERGPLSWPAVSWLMMMRMAMRKNSHLSGWKEEEWVCNEGIQRRKKRVKGSGKTGKNLHMLLIISAIKSNGILPSHQSAGLNGRRHKKSDKINKWSKITPGYKEWQWEKKRGKICFSTLLLAVATAISPCLSRISPLSVPTGFFVFFSFPSFKPSSHTFFS